MSGWAAGTVARGGADACKHGALGALWTCTGGARCFASGIHSDPILLVFGRVVLLEVVRSWDMLSWPVDQVVFEV